MTSLEQEIGKLGPWFHNIHLPDGTQTAPDHYLGDFPAWKWAELAPVIPSNLTGWTALDVGCNAGYYSFQLARRGISAELDDEEHVRPAPSERVGCEEDGMWSAIQPFCP